MRTLSESDGDTVEWKNNSFLEHEIISGNPDDGPSGLFSGVVPDPGSFIFTFNDVGVYDYYNPDNPRMVGSVTVIEP